MPQNVNTDTRRAQTTNFHKPNFFNKLPQKLKACVFRNTMEVYWNYIDQWKWQKQVITPQIAKIQVYEI